MPPMTGIPISIRTRSGCTFWARVRASEPLVASPEGSHDQAKPAGRVLMQLIRELYKGEIELMPFDINALIEKMASSKLRNTEIRSFRVTLNLEQGLGPVMGCKLQTEKVLLNLIQNGIDSMDEAGVCPFSFAISVCSATGRAMPHITVRDCGPGGNSSPHFRAFLQHQTQLAWPRARHQPFANRGPGWSTLDRPGRWAGRRIPLCLAFLPCMTVIRPSFSLTMMPPSGSPCPC